jgi:tyrosine-protein phosphatase YwqE
MFERMAALVAAGALIQATADFFLREEMEAGMLAMAEAGLVHVLSSDAHSSLGGRPLRLAPAFERLGAVASLAPRIEWMSETAPCAIVSGGAVELPFEPSL